MPIYEYECRKCKAHVEALQKVSDKPLTKCKECGGQLEKQMSRTSFQFKGSGWYVTDYAGKKADDAAKQDAKSDGDAGNGKDTKEPSNTTETASKDKAAKKAEPAAKKTESSTSKASTKDSSASGD